MRFLLLLFCCLFCTLCFGQRFTISGTITDENNGEHLIGASLYNHKSAAGTTTNTYGFYSLTFPKDSVHLRVSYVGYQPQVIKFYLSKDTTISVRLMSGSELKEVEIVGNREDNIQESTRMGTIDIPIHQIKAVPALLGEVDVLKVLQLLPGVQSGSEGSSGIYVRGGGPDQNLILLDGVPVYNASHLFGFFSVFNADAINRVELIKGGFPARYGGRLSSVIDISMKEGNANKLQGEGAAGLVASRLTIEGPIDKKTSFIVSGRRTYIDLLARPLIRQQSKGKQVAGYYFYDLNAKINHQLNSSNRLYLSLYSGDDKAFARSKDSYSNNQETSTYNDEFKLQWGNLTTALRWNKIINKKLFSNVTATYSRYRFVTGGVSDQTTTTPDTTTRSYYSIDYTSGIRDYSLKVDFDYMPSPAHFVKFGGQVIDHLFTPGVLTYDIEDEGPGVLGAAKNYATEFSIYAEDDFMVSDKLKVNAGVHASGFAVDSKFYRSVQPRFSARYLLSPAMSLKASYALMTQYIHLLSNVGIGLPTDLWVSSTDLIKPENSMQVAIGSAYNLRNEYEFTVEAYYKEMDGLIEYKDGATYLNVESDWQTKVETGSGESYGGEFFVQKKTGKFNGWVGYTLSWTNRQFDNLNGGKKYPYKYDRRHDIEIVGSYEMRKNREFGLTWVYGTGAAVTLPQSSYMHEQPTGQPFYPWQEGEIQYYDSRNSYRMRAYHRLDLSFTTTKQTKWGERSWVIGVYNVYSRRNPFFLDVGYDKQGNKKFIQYSLFPIIPSISYRFKF